MLSDCLCVVFIKRPAGKGAKEMRKKKHREEGMNEREWNRRKMVSGKRVAGNTWSYLFWTGWKWRRRRLETVEAGEVNFRTSLIRGYFASLSRQPRFMINVWVCELIGSRKGAVRKRGHGALLWESCELNFDWIVVIFVWDLVREFMSQQRRILILWENFEEENRDKTLKRSQEIREIVYELGHDIIDYVDISSLVTL